MFYSKRTTARQAAAKLFSIHGAAYAALMLMLCAALALTGCVNAPAGDTPNASESAAPQTDAPEATPDAPEQTEPADDGNELPRLDDEELLTRLDELCNTYYVIKELTGLSVGVLIDGKIAYFNYGVTDPDGENVDENTIYEIASLTKTFTATLFALDANAGRVELDQPVQDFFENPVPKYRGEMDMTLRNLATHTAGLPRVPTNFVETLNPYNDYTEDMLLEYLGEGVLRCEPGTKYEYSNLGMGLLGYILGKVNGEPYADLLRERLLEPLDMSSTAIVLTDEQQQRKAGAYLSSGAPAREWDFDVLQACGGLKSTTRDLLRYMAANLMELDMSTELCEAIALTHRIHFSGNGVQLGLGWHQANYSGVGAMAHDGLVGGYCSFNAFSTSENIAAVILCNNATTVSQLGADLMLTLSRARTE